MVILFFFFFNDTATTEIYTLSLHDALPIRKVASRSSQHSKMFGQPASSHTVCRPSRWTRFFSARYSGPVRSRVLIHGGFFSIGVWLFLVSSRRSRRPSGAITTTSAYVLAHPAQSGVTPALARKNPN